MNPHEETAEAADGSGGGETRPVLPPVFRRGVHPGEVLKAELAVLGVSLSAFARQIAVAPSDVTRIVKGQRDVTARMALRFGHWFGAEPLFWLTLQAQYYLAQAEEECGEAVRRLPTKESPPAPPKRRGRPPSSKRAQGDQA